MAAFFRYSSFAALVTVFWTPVVLNEFGVNEAVVLWAALAVLIIARHHANIGRLLSGSEPTIGERAKS
jgi:glycerol-3-phosphate acyltransferase PlsY